MNQYGQMAMEHWRKHRPAEFAGMTDPQTFFQELGEQIETRILDRAEELEDGIPAGLPYQERLNRMTAARSEAQSLVLEEMLPRAEDDEEPPEDQVPATEMTLLPAGLMATEVPPTA